MKDTNKRWLGLASYEECDSEIFYGREKEIKELSGDIFHNTQTIIYGPSGVGKTSIIRAGIFKLAREERFLPIYIRLNHDSGIGYDKQIIDEIIKEAKLHNVDIENQIAYIGEECNSLWEFFHCNAFWDAQNYPVTPLFVIDQFEELFTLSQNNNNKIAFFEQISDLCDNKYPVYVKEYLSNEKRINYPESVNYRVVISLREDFLARLEEYAVNIPALKRNRFSLQTIYEEQAMDIILKPSNGVVSHDVAIEIIQKVTNRKDFTIDGINEIVVEPAILSLFCNELDKKRIENGESEISSELVERFGDDIIKEFYRRIMGLVSRSSVAYLEDSLLTGDGYRDNVSLHDAFAQGLTKGELDILCKNRIIRIEERNLRKRIEFTHDVLCKVAMANRSDRETLQALDREKAKNENLKRRNKTQSIYIALGVLFTITTAIFLLFAFVLPYSEHHGIIIKKEGWFEGIEKLSKNESSYRTHYFVLRKKGFFKAHWESMEARDGYHNLTTNHNLGTYLLDQYDDTDSLANNEMRDKLKTVCKWDFTQNLEGNFLLQERGLDSLGNVVFCYNRTKTEDEKQIIATFTDELGFPIKLRDEYMFIRITYDDRGYETLYEFFDDDGYRWTNKDGAFMTSKEYTNEGLQTAEASLGLAKTQIIDRFGNCGWRVIYNEFNGIESTYVDENDNPCRIGAQHGAVIRKKWDYDKHRRLIMESYWDDKGNKDINGVGVHRYELEYNHHGQRVACYLFDKDDKPCSDTTGFMGYHNEFDECGRVIMCKNIDVDTTTLSRYKYSSNGTLIWQSNYEIIYGDTTLTYQYTYDEKEKSAEIYHKGSTTIREKYDKYNRQIHWSYYDTLNVTPIMKFGYHRNEIEYQYSENKTIRTDEYYDTHGNLCIPDDYEYARSITHIDSVGFSKTITEYDNNDVFIASRIQQYDNTFSKVISEQNIGITGDPERNYTKNSFCYKALVDYPIKALQKNKFGNFLGVNEYGEPSLINGNNILYYFSIFNNKDETIYFDEYDKQINDMKKYIANRPFVPSISLKNSDAQDLGFKSNDVIIGCNDWIMKFDKSDNQSPFAGFREAMWDEVEREITVLRFNSEEGTHKPVKFTIPSNIDVSDYVTMYYLYCTDKEKLRFEGMINDNFYYKAPKGKIVEDGEAYKRGLRGSFYLLKYCSWEYGDSIDDMISAINDNRELEKNIVYLDNLGSVQSVTLPQGVMGIHFTSEFVSKDKNSNMKTQYSDWKKMSNH